MQFYIFWKLLLLVQIFWSSASNPQTILDSSVLNIFMPINRIRGIIALERDNLKVNFVKFVKNIKIYHLMVYLDYKSILCMNKPTHRSKIRKLKNGIESWVLIKNYLKNYLLKYLKRSLKFWILLGHNLL